MPRPRKIKSETKTYNLTIEVDKYNRLAEIAGELHKRAFEQVAVADLIRNAIDIYLEALEEEIEEDDTK